MNFIRNNIWRRDEIERPKMNFTFSQVYSGKTSKRSEKKHTHTEKDMGKPKIVSLII